MEVHSLAGKPVPRYLLINVPRLVSAYYAYQPEADDPNQQVLFGTSGHRGCSLDKSFNENHILAVSQAICEYRKQQAIQGPLFMGMDTHALSEPAQNSALEVFAANGVEVFIQEEFGYTPTPAISHAILTWNLTKKGSTADGVVITPSHNPPKDGGFKYNPPEGGPADEHTTGVIQQRANEILGHGLKQVRRIPLQKALRAETTHNYDYISPYVDELGQVLDMKAIASAGLKIGVDPMGGSALYYWDRIADKFGLDIEVVNKIIDPTFAFMTVDKDGAVRMDCSSKYAMAGLISLKEKFDIAFGNDPDNDRHGIVTKSGGLMNPNHFLASAVWYLYQYRPNWDQNMGIGKTLVTSSMIDRVADLLNRKVVEVPVGFKWFVSGLLQGRLGFGGEESAGASFVRQDTRVWTTDKDGLIMDLLAAEITAKSGKDPWQVYQDLEKKLGTSYYQRLDVPATPQQKKALKSINPDMVKTNELAGEKIRATLNKAPGNNASIGGLKVVAENGWFAARPSGTEDIYKIYAESFKNEQHLQQVIDEAQHLVDAVLGEA